MHCMGSGMVLDDSWFGTGGEERRLVGHWQSRAVEPELLRRTEPWPGEEELLQRRQCSTSRSSAEIDAPQRSPPCASLHDNGGGETWERE